MSLPSDWQINRQNLSERGRYLLDTGRWSDCEFIVGQEPQQQRLKGHKLFLAMSSPVFEAMFFGSMAEKTDPIPIRDVQPDAFKALLEYIYTDAVELGSFEVACELCYCAKKYMLPSLVEKCTKFLWSDLSPNKACRAYEFAKLFEEPVLMQKCLEIICTNTREVLNESTWEEIEFGTLICVLEQDALKIDSEMELYSALEHWTKAECLRKSLDYNDGKTLRSVIGSALFKIRFLTLTPQEFADGPGVSSLLTQDEAFSILMNLLCTENKIPMPEGFSTNTSRRTKASPRRSTTMDFHYKARCTPLQSVRARVCKYRNVLPLRQSFRITAEENSVAESSEPTGIVNGTGRETENLIKGGVRQGLKYYCQRLLLERTEYLNTHVLDTNVTFTVDKDIYVLGIQVPAQIAAGGNSMKYVLKPDIWYTDTLYAYLLDSNKTRLTHTHVSTKAHMGGLIDIIFDRCVYIQKEKVYTIGVAFSSAGWYPLGIGTQNMTCDSVSFSFRVEEGTDSSRDGLIRSIIFSYPL